MCVCFCGFLFLGTQKIAVLLLLFLKKKRGGTQPHSRKPRPSATSNRRPRARPCASSGMTRMMARQAWRGDMKSGAAVRARWFQVVPSSSCSWSRPWYLWWNRVNQKETASSHMQQTSRAPLFAERASCLPRRCFHLKSALKLKVRRSFRKALIHTSLFAWICCSTLAAWVLFLDLG